MELPLFKSELEIELEEKYKYLSTDIKLEPKQWDKSKMKVNSNHAQYIQLYNILKDKIKNYRIMKLIYLKKTKNALSN